MGYSHSLTKRRAPEKPKLLLSERECLRALGKLTRENGGRIPSLAEIVREMGDVVKISRACRLLRNLEAKGYIRRRLELVA